MAKRSPAELGESLTSSLPPPSPTMSPPPSTSAIRSRSRSDPLLIVCRCFSLLTAITAVLCVLVNALSVVLCFKHGTDIVGGVFRCYAVLIAVFVAVTETEWSLIFKFVKVLEYWVGRGMLQILYAYIADKLVGVMTRAFPDVHGERQDIVLLQEIASYMLMICGVIYVISGLLCLGFIKRAHQHQEITRDQAIKNLEELEKQREELEALLLQDRP